MTATEPPRTNDETAQSAPVTPRLSGEDRPAVVVDPGDPVLPPRAEAVVRRRRVESRQRRITWWQVGTTVAFVVALVVLSWVGYRSALRVGGGSAERVTDPNEPGYLAEPVPTAVDSYVITNPDGSFASALLVVPDASGSGGTIVPLPPSFMVPEFQGSVPQFLSTLYDEGGPDGFRERLGIALGFSIGSVREVPSAAIEELAGGVAIEVDNVDDLAVRNEDGSTEARYPAGPMTLEPSGIVEYLGFEGADDPAPNQAIRATEVWETLLSTAADSTHEDLPEGESSDGADSPSFGEAIDSLIAGEVTYDVVPMASVPVPNSYFVAWMPDPSTLNDFVARVVPVPTSPAAGIRPATAVLNGTTDPALITPMVSQVVASGGAVTLVGNADALDVATTTVQWSTPGGRLVAEAIAERAGVTATEAAPGAGDELGGVEVIVIMGSDGGQ